MGKDFFQLSCPFFCETKKLNYFCAFKKFKNFKLNNSLIVIYVKSLRDRFHRNSRFV